MSKQAFPEAYNGRGKRFGSSARGVECWDTERAVAIAGCEKNLLELENTGQPERPIDYAARASNLSRLSLLYAWEERAEPARKRMADCAAITHDYFQRFWPDINPANCYPFAIQGAIAAALVNQPDLARTYFTHAAHFSAGLVTGQEAAPASRSSRVMHVLDYALVQAYSQLRLGELSGFRALLYPVGFPEAKRQPPVLRVGSIGDILQTIDTAIAVGQATRDDTGLMWNHIRFLIPVLRTLYGYLQQPADEAAEHARKALTKYYEMIRNLADFPVIYLRVLDLQKAYPRVYGEITPSVFA